MDFFDFFKSPQSTGLSQPDSVPNPLDSFIIPHSAVVVKRVLEIFFIFFRALAMFFNSRLSLLTIFIIPHFEVVVKRIFKISFEFLTAPKSDRQWTYRLCDLQPLDNYYYTLIDSKSQELF